MYKYLFRKRMVQIACVYKISQASAIEHLEKEMIIES